VGVGVIPALLASLASSVLPVSNLTNLIAVQSIHVSLGDFLAQMAIPSALAIAIGCAVHIRYLRRTHVAITSTAFDEPVDRTSFAVGIPVVIWLVVGFTLGHDLSVAPWVVAGIALLGLMALRRHVPWRAIPVGAIAIATSLGVVAAGAARHLPVDDLLSIRGIPGEVATFGAFAVGANAINNLPALLLATPALEAEPDRLWPVLLGVNLGPTLWVTGALSTLLWQSTMARLGHHVSARSYARFGARVGIPVLIAVAVCRAAQVWLQR
jgi:arsenical pump membrane protein